MTSRWARAAPYLVVLCGAILLYRISTRFDYQPRPGTLGPEVWPQAILLLAILVCVWQLVGALLLGPVRHDVDGILGDISNEAQASGKEQGESLESESHPLRVVLGMGATVAYVALVTPMGFFLATSAYLAVFLVLARYPRLGMIAALSVLGTLVLMLVFMKLVYVSLPIGEGPFAPVMIFLMSLMAIR